MQRIIKNNLFPSKNNEYPLNVIILSLFYQKINEFNENNDKFSYHYVHYSIDKARVHVISPIGPASCWRSILVESWGLVVMDWDCRLVGSAHGVP